MGRTMVCRTQWVGHNGSTDTMGRTQWFINYVGLNRHRRTQSCVTDVTDRTRLLILDVSVYPTNTHPSDIPTYKITISSYWSIKLISFPALSPHDTLFKSPISKVNVVNTSSTLTLVYKASLLSKHAAGRID